MLILTIKNHNSLLNTIGLEFPDLYYFRSISILQNKVILKRTRPLLYEYIFHCFNNVYFI
jgi:hypothetical protein